MDVEGEGWFVEIGGVAEGGGPGFGERAEVGVEGERGVNGGVGSEPPLGHAREPQREQQQERRDDEAVAEEEQQDGVRARLHGGQGTYRVRMT